MWNNPDLYVYHGTSLPSAEGMRGAEGSTTHAIDLTRCRPALDFGHCFYVTTRLDQAIAWANRPHRLYERKGRRGRRPDPAAVIRFRVRRDDLAALEDLVFTDPDGGAQFFAFTKHCRDGQNPANGRARPYAVIAGPVLAWPNDVTIPRMDQIGFTDAALNILLEPVILRTGTPTI